MTTPFGRVLGAALVAMALPVLAPLSAAAQETTNQVAVATDWSVFEFPALCGTERQGEECRQPGTKPTECWAVSAPDETVNTRDGQPVEVQRGDIRLFITYRPGSAGEISFTGGYPFPEGSRIAVDLDGKAFEMASVADFKEWAWTLAPDQDVQMLEAMKAGTKIKMTAKSARGTQTEDTFSLRGFTAAITEAEGRCK